MDKVIPVPDQYGCDTHQRARNERVHLGPEIRTAMMVAQRELIRFTRARSRLFSSLVQPLVFLFILGYGLSRLVGTTGEVSFVQFLMPGVIAMTVVFASISSGLSVLWDREFGFLREMLVAPPYRATLVVGKVAGGAFVATVQGTLLLVLAPVVGITLNALLLVSLIGIAALTAIALTALGVLLASTLRRMESFQSLMQLIMMPMIFLSGAIFPLRDLPGWLAVLTHINPLTYAVDPMRQAVFAAQNINPAAVDRFAAGIQLFGHTLPIAVELAIVAGFAFVFTALSIRSFGKPE